jgi:hypothetical protein
VEWDEAAFLLGEWEVDAAPRRSDEGTRPGALSFRAAFSETGAPGPRGGLEFRMAAGTPPVRAPARLGLLRNPDGSARGMLWDATGEMVPCRVRGHLDDPSVIFESEPVPDHVGHRFTFRSARPAELAGTYETRPPDESAFRRVLRLMARRKGFR